MRTYLYFILIVFCLKAGSAQTVVKGMVLDANDGSPLYFATVVVDGQPYGTLTGTDGQFELNVPETLAPETMISTSYLGYETVQFRLDALREKETISLRPAAVGLPIISVGAAGELTDVELGRKERKAYTFYQDLFDQTFQLATRIENPEQRPGVITSIRYFFGKAAKKGKPVRLNFYAVDPGCDCPGEPLHAASVIPAKNKKGWNKLDLTADQVSLPAGDFFIAFEWLGVGLPNPEAINFSVGIVPDRNAAPLYQKIGGAAWAEATERGPYRPLVRVRGKVN